MKSNPNLILAWLWILLGFTSGMVLGMFFHGDKWLGGYASFKRRMYRLGHISFFGLGAVNLLFCLTVEYFSLSGPLVYFASVSFIVGAIAMPVCCVVMAHVPKAHLIFAVPVISLILGAVLTLILIYSHQTTPLINTRLQPGVGRTLTGEPFQRLAGREKPLKRLLALSSAITGLKPGVNEKFRNKHNQPSTPNHP